MLSNQVQQKVSHFAADRGVIGGVDVKWLRGFFVECMAFFGMVRTLFWVKIVLLE